MLCRGNSGHAVQEPSLQTLTPFFPLNLFRTYAIRRIRDAFRENKNVKDPVEIQALVNKAKRDLEIIRRQVHIGQLYSTDKLIIENQEKPRT
nr:LYR motif-containing protein 4 [Vicugna pacos]